MTKLPTNRGPTVKVYFSLNELTYQAKKKDKQGSLEMKSFHSILMFVAKV